MSNGKIINKTVFILGAGCSQEDNVPLVNDFFEIAFEKILDGNTLNSSEKERFEKIRNLRENLLPGSNIEELFSYIDLRKNLFPDISPSELEKIRNDLLYVIAKTIKENVIHKKSAIYKKFKENHLNKYEHPTIISFNWDLLADNVLFPPGIMFDVAGIFEADYGSDFLNIDDSNNVYKTNRNTYCTLLKLHGSLNWLYCSKCKKDNKYFIYGRKAAVDMMEGIDKKCPKCGRDLTMLMVPPTIQKIEDGGILTLLGSIWKEAEDALSEAECIYIIGYSFPEDDVHFRHFFRSTLVKNYKKNKKEIEINVINYKPYLQQKSDFEKHYMDILEIPTVKVNPTFYYMKFSKFVRNKNI